MKGVALLGKSRSKQAGILVMEGLQVPIPSLFLWPCFIFVLHFLPSFSFGLFVLFAFYMAWYAFKTCTGRGSGN